MMKDEDYMLIMDQLKKVTENLEKWTDELYASFGKESLSYKSFSIMIQQMQVTKFSIHEDFYKSKNKHK